MNSFVLKIRSNENFYEKTVFQIADKTHEKFKEIYRALNNGSRIKPTNDKNWTNKHNTSLADLAKLMFVDLPSDWKMERWNGSKEALESLIFAIESTMPLDKNFIEFAADRIHQEWLKRNVDRASAEHKLSYGELSEEAKDKDRIFAVSALEVYATLGEHEQ